MTKTEYITLGKQLLGELKSAQRKIHHRHPNYDDYLFEIQIIKSRIEFIENGRKISGLNMKPCPDHFKEHESQLIEFYQYFELNKSADN
jgi:hypothetical protein